MGVRVQGAQGQAIQEVGVASVVQQGGLGWLRRHEGRKARVKKTFEKLIAYDLNCRKSLRCCEIYAENPAAKA